MLINVVQEEESRVAIVDGGVLSFFEIETLSSETLKGTSIRASSRINPSLEAAFVNSGWDRPGFLPLDEVNFKVLPAIKTRKGGSRIVEHVSPGMEFLVQVIRDRFDSKPPSLTTYYSLPGRYLVLTPSSDGSGVSRPSGRGARAKLRRMMEDLRPPGTESSCGRPGSIRSAASWCATWAI
jgi:ribonuclease E